jgi:hypothetical protein
MLRESPGERADQAAAVFFEVDTRNARGLHAERKSAIRTAARAIENPLRRK